MTGRPPPLRWATVDLRTSVYLVASTTVVAVTGSIDLATVPALRDALLAAVADHPGERVAVDLDEVDVLDDTGLGILLGVAARARRHGGDLVIVCANPRLRQRFSLTGLDRAITVTTGLADHLPTDRAPDAFGHGGPATP